MRLMLTLEVVLASASEARRKRSLEVLLQVMTAKKRRREDLDLDSVAKPMSMFQMLT